MRVLVDTSVPGGVVGLVVLIQPVNVTSIIVIGNTQ